MSAHFCKTFVLSFLAVCLSWRCAVADEPSAALLKVKKTVDLPLLEDASLEAGRSLWKREQSGARVENGTQIYQVWNVEFRDAAACQKFQVEGASILTRFERFADVFVPADPASRKQVVQSAGYVWHDVAVPGLIPPPPRPTPTKDRTRQIPEPIVRGGVNSLTGKGVVIAVLDTGLDIRHPDFISYDAKGQPTSRVLHFWDTASQSHAVGIGKPAPFKYPNGTPIGTVFDRDALTAELRGSRPRVAVWDASGHGTACAGIAAGSGQMNKEHVGVAPAADIIAVKLTAGTEQGGGIENAYLLGAACEWLDGLVKQRPLVISCSFGGHQGGHDGSRIEERQLDARFPSSRRGRAVCIAAGNSGADAMHAAATIKGEDSAARLVWMAPAEAEVEIYIPGGKREDLTCVQLGETPWKVRIDVHAPTGQLVLTLRCEPGVGGIELSSRSGKPYPADAYITGGGFADSVASFERLVGTPGTATTVITVGSYDWNDEFDVDGRPVAVLDAGKPLRLGGLSRTPLPVPGEAIMPPSPKSSHPANTTPRRRRSTSVCSVIRAVSIASSTARVPPLPMSPASPL